MTTPGNLRIHQGYPLVLACCLAIAHPAIAFDQLYLFGDSLTDSGNEGRFVYDGDNTKLYVDRLAEYFNLGSVAPSSALGNNYAVGGAVAIPELNRDNNTQAQVEQYLELNGGKANSQGLYVYWVGGNDLAAALPSPQRDAIILSSANGAADQIEQLLQAGAGTVIVPTVPNIGLTPALMNTIVGLIAGPEALDVVRDTLNAAGTLDITQRQEVLEQALFDATGDNGFRNTLLQGLYSNFSALARDLTTRYNSEIESRLASNPGNIVRVDINGLFNEIIADPARYGFNNTVGYACPVGVSASVCFSTDPLFDDHQKFLFSDPFHPAPEAHAIAGEYVIAVLEAPLQVAGLNMAAPAIARNSRATLDSHLQQRYVKPGTPGEWRIFGGYAGEHDKNSHETLSEGSSTNHHFTLGVDYQLTEALQLGAMFSSSYGDFKPSSDFNYTAIGTQFSAFGALKFLQGGWVNADLHLLNLQYDDIERRINLSPNVAAFTEQGESSGRQWGSRVKAGWDFALVDEIVTGPVLQFIWDYHNIDGYAENSNSSRAMYFFNQTYHSQIGGIGWRINAPLAIANLYSEVNYNHQFGDTADSVRGRLKSAQTSFLRESEREASWVEAMLGASIPVTSQLTAFAGLSHSIGLNDSNQLRYNIGMSAEF